MVCQRIEKRGITFVGTIVEFWVVTAKRLFRKTFDYKHNHIHFLKILSRIWLMNRIIDQF